MTPPLRIVIAEDEPDSLLYFQGLLSRLGHVVVATASTGRQLVDRCTEYDPDLVITDIRMPDMDGIEAASLVFQVNPVPVIVFSAFHSGPILIRAQENPVFGYLVKPIDEADLEAAIAVALGRFEDSQALRREVADLRSRLAGMAILPV
jgi:two-component system, response regulator PdtaR